MPERLADNLKTEYAVIRDFTEDVRLLQEYIELAYKNRSDKADKRVNNRVQMDKDKCS